MPASLKEKRMNKVYRPRISIDMDAADARFLSDILPYGQRMSILRLIVKDFIEELKRNPDLMEDLILRSLPRTTKVAVSRSFLQTVAESLTFMIKTSDQPPEYAEQLKRLEALLK